MGSPEYGIIGDTMPGPRVLVDTNVLVAGLRSRRGVAFRLLAEIGKGRFEIALSVPLVLEYEDVLLRPQAGKLGRADVDAVLDYFCKVAHLHQIFFLWRPLLNHPHDDILLELAVPPRCQSIVPYNVRAFPGAGGFGISFSVPGPS